MRFVDLCIGLALIFLGGSVAFLFLCVKALVAKQVQTDRRLDSNGIYS